MSGTIFASSLFGVGSIGGEVMLSRRLPCAAGFRGCGKVGILVLDFHFSTARRRLVDHEAGGGPPWNLSAQPTPNSEEPNIFPSTVGQALTLTASIDGSAAVPTGTVQFLEGTQPLGTRTLSGGQAAFTITPTTAGTHTFFANYSGDSAYPAASVRYFQMVNRVADSLSLSSSAAASVSGQTLTFTAQIGPQPPAGVASPSGRVQFLDGLSVIGTGTPSSGAATFNFASLAMGSHQIAAFYSGDNNWYPVKSAYIAVTDNRAATTTVLSVAPALTQATLYCHRDGDASGIRNPCRQRTVHGHGNQHGFRHGPIFREDHGENFH